MPHDDLPMTGERMQDIREWMQLSVRSMAKLLDRNEGTLRKMEAGDRPIPAPIADWLASLESWQISNPPPRKVR